MNKIKIYSDGGARGNPGPAGIGFIVFKNDQEIFSHSAFLGNSTNNIAEHKAIMLALKYLLESKIQADQIECFLDSELVVKQLRGEYKIKNNNLLIIAQKTFLILDKLSQSGCGQVIFTHIPREKNSQADALANQAMDSGTLY
jgi:ribonuclease HI